MLRLHLGTAPAGLDPAAKPGFKMQRCLLAVEQDVAPALQVLAQVAPGGARDCFRPCGCQ